ncbi:MAG: hypothetical protein AUG51_00025 [Acidobacteria bacterium 13_1_20CM_3_53_8]|nr:MAG: hypothetical protein AUG51_00025 [Acidobacteria bacterium 13_1_20CM_3_53_8]
MEFFRITQGRKRLKVLLGEESIIVGQQSRTLILGETINKHWQVRMITLVKNESLDFVSVGGEIEKRGVTRTTVEAPASSAF